MIVVMTQDTQPSPLKTLLTKALFVIGIIFLIVVIGFALLFIVPRIVSGIGGAASALTSIFRGAAGDGIAVTTTASRVKTEEEFTISWDDVEATPTTSHAVSFSCVENTTVRIDGKRAQCEKNIDVSFAENDIDVEIENTKVDSVAEVAFKIAAIESGEEKRSGKTVVAATNGAPSVFDDSSDDDTATDTTDSDVDDKPAPSGGSTVTSKPSTSSTGSTTVKPTAGKANLYISRAVTGTWREGVVFVANRIEEDEIGGVEFTVINDGGTATGPWTFTYTEPTARGDVRSAGTQPSIPAGGSLTYTIKFPSYAEGMKSTTITLDTSNSVAERNEYDNSRTEVLLFDATSNDQGTGGGSFNKNDDANLTVEILGTGRLDGRRFVETDNVDSNDELAVRFKIKNDGGESTGAWRFMVELSGDDDQDYESARQPSLAPGQSAEYTLAFDGIDRDAESVTFKVTADSDDDVDEEDERDNEESERVRLD
jgi:hypothetical protein